MISYRLRFANEIGVQPAYIKGEEKHGLCFFTWDDSEATGAQCSCCHTVVWLNIRLNKIFSEPKPPSIPESGKGYTTYYENKLERFLMSLPDCPVCGNNKYDKFINNVSFPRFSDGMIFDDKEGQAELINENPEHVKIWWLDQ